MPDFLKFFFPLQVKLNEYITDQNMKFNFGRHFNALVNAQNFINKNLPYWSFNIRTIKVHKFLGMLMKVQGFLSSNLIINII